MPKDVESILDLLIFFKVMDNIVKLINHSKIPHFIDLREAH